MTSEAEVSKGPSVTLPGIGDKCETDPDSRQDLPSGSSSDLSQANDLDKSYVFVTGEDGVPDDPVGDVDAISVSQNDKVDAVIGQVDESLDEGRTGGVQLFDGVAPLRTDKSLADPEAKPVEDPPAVKSPNTEGVVVDEVRDQDVVKFESTPASVENQESEVGLGAPELALEAIENRDLNNMSLHISASGNANDGCEKQNGDGECINQVDMSSVEKLDANQGSQVENVDEVKSSGQMVGCAEVEIPSPGSSKLDMEPHTVNNQEEMDDSGSKTTLSLEKHEHHKLDTALESDGEFVSEHRDETETVASIIDCHVESVCDLILEEKTGETVSFVGSDIQHAEEVVKHPDGGGISHETMHAESKTEASLLTQTAPSLSAHPPETEWEISVAENKTEASLLIETIPTSSAQACPPETESENSGAENKTETSLLIEKIPPSSAYPLDIEMEITGTESKTEASLLIETIPPSNALPTGTEREISDAEGKTEASLLNETVPPSSAHPPGTEREISEAESKTEASLLNETVSPSSAHPPETERGISDAESRTDASLLIETVTPSSAHPSETGREISEAAGIETVASLLVGTTSNIMENKLSADDSGIRSPMNKDLTQEPEKPTFQDGEATAEVEVSSGLSAVAHSQPARNDVKLEPGVHVNDTYKISEGEKMDAVLGTCTAEILDSNVKLEPGVHVTDNSTIGTGEKMDAVMDTCTTEVLDGFTAENGSVDNSVFETEPIQNMHDQLDAAAGDSHENELQENEDPRKSATFVVTSEPDIHVSDKSSNEGKTDALFPTYRSEELNSFNVGGVTGTALQVEEIHNLVDQSNCAAGCNHENISLQENEVTGKSEVIEVNSEHGVDVLRFSAASSGENTGAASGACKIVILDRTDALDEGVANTGLEIEDGQYTGVQLDGATGDSHEVAILQENEVTRRCETSDAKLEHDVHVRSFSAVRSGEKTDEKSPACRTEVLDNYSVDQEGIENNEREDFQNTGDKKSDGAADSNHEKLVLQENEVTRESGSDNISEAEPGGSVSITIVREEDTLKTITKPFNFLVRVPRFDDENLREQIRLAKQDVDEKTKIRDAIQALVHERRTSNQIHGVDFEFARAEGRTARNLVRSKRVEIDSLQSMINKAKNALSIDDIDNRIQNMERMIQHETLPLKEEKQIIREIKQMKQLREQLSSNLGNKEEIKHALEQREEAEDRLKTLRKELDVLKDQVLKAEAACMEAGKKYDDENKKIRELQAQFRAADDVRQLAYVQLQSLRKLLSKKNEHFFKYKDAAAVANNYAFSGNTDALYGLCTENVKNFMELWNTDSEFRKDYIRCNVRSTIRRLGTLDGRALGPDEQPPILPSSAEAKTSNTISATVKVDVASPIAIPEVKEETTVKTVPSEDKPMQKAKEPKTQKMANKEIAAPVIETGYDPVSDLVDADVVHEEPKKSEEEIKREEAEASKLKEQRRLEAQAKSDEARERKKRRAEKLLMRSELKLQKEAEQKEKEREKRLRKKERKKAGTTEVNDTNHHSETAPSSESASEISKDMEVKDMSSATPAAKKAQKRWPFTKQSKSKTIPPPLRGRNKRKLLQQWMWVGFACFVIVFLFWMGNVSLFSNGIPKRHRPLY